MRGLPPYLPPPHTHTRVQLTGMVGLTVGLRDLRLVEKLSQSEDARSSFRAARSVSCPARPAALCANTRSLGKDEHDSLTQGVRCVNVPASVQSRMGEGGNCTRRVQCL